MHLFMFSVAFKSVLEDSQSRKKNKTKEKKRLTS